MIHLVRLLFLFVVIAITISFAFQPPVEAQGLSLVLRYLLIPVVIALAAILTDMFWRRKHLKVMSGLFLGMIAGLLFAYMFALVTDMVVNMFGLSTTSTEEKAKLVRLTVLLIKLLLGTASVYFCVSFVLQTRDDFRFIIPYVEFQKESKGPRPFILDTSVIIDGRIADLAPTRILESEVLVPRFVLEELQTIADSSDKLKRNRGRRGLDILNRLQNTDVIDIRIMDTNAAEVASAADVDGKLLALAQHISGRIVTNDFNLNKVAQLRGVEVININDLANALKPVVLPGETMRIKIIKPGEEAGQGVGYLDDGTMVVVEQGRDYIGRDVTITVTSALQTSAGRMIFGRLDADRTFSPSQKSRSTNPPAQNNRKNGRQG